MAEGRLGSATWSGSGRRAEDPVELVPPLDEQMGELSGLDTVERALEDHHLVAVAEVGDAAFPVLSIGRDDEHHLEAGVLGEEPVRVVEDLVLDAGDIEEGHRRGVPGSAHAADLVQTVDVASDEPHVERAGGRRGHLGRRELVQREDRIAGAIRDQHLEQVEEEVLLGTDEDDAIVHTGALCKGRSAAKPPQRGAFPEAPGGCTPPPCQRRHRSGRSRGGWVSYLRQA